MALFVHWIGPLADHVLISARRIRHILQFLRHGAAGDGHAVAVEQAFFEQHFQHLRHTTGAMEIHRDITARRFEIAQHRHLAAHALEIIDGPFDLGGMSDGEEVQHRVGRAAGGHDQRHRVFDRLAGDDVARADVVFDGVDQHARGIRRRIGFFRIGRGHLRGTECAHAQRFERRRHRVRGEHTAAGADRRTGIFFNTDKILFAHLAGSVRADGLECADDGQILAFPFARFDGAGVDVDARHVHAQHGDHAARHVLVAAAADQHAVHGLAIDRSFNTVSDDFARHQRILHCLGAHADAVGDGRHAEHLRHRTGGLQRSDGAIDQWLDAGIAGVHRRVAVSDADDGFVEVAVTESHGAQHGPVGGARNTGGDQLAAFIERHLCSPMKATASAIRAASRGTYNRPFIL